MPNAPPQLTWRPFDKVERPEIIACELRNAAGAGLTYAAGEGRAPPSPPLTLRHPLRAAAAAPPRAATKRHGLRAIPPEPHSAIFGCANRLRAKWSKPILGTSACAHHPLQGQTLPSLHYRLHHLMRFFCNKLATPSLCTTRVCERYRLRVYSLRKRSSISCPVKVDTLTVFNATSGGDATPRCGAVTFGFLNSGGY